ncbi:gamma-glutamylaminecyclotransferase B-like [Neosynchiropus ocellatus]
MACVFVYGTLRRGQPNNYRMSESSNGSAEFLATAQTVQPYPLVIATAFNIPFLLNIPGQGQRVHGEIYRVDEQMLKFLDEFESIPTMYQRTSVKLEVKEWARNKEGEETPAAGSITEAFVYSTTTYQPEWKTLPTYDNYDSFGAHGLQYVVQEARN